jgi:putative membrane protein
MMYWGNGDWNWAAWLAMSGSMVLFWGLIAWTIVAVGRQPCDTPRSPEDVLADRFVHGEIDDEDFRRRRDALRSSR